MLYIDVDALCKLSHWNILPILPELTGYPWTEIATVSSLRHRAARSREQPDGRLFHTTDAAASVCTCITQMAAAPDPNPDLLSALADAPQIDSGEAVLLALAAHDPNGRFLTGDKRALRALSQTEHASLFAEKVFILEQVLQQCLRHKGHTWLLENVCPLKHIDKAVSMILGSRCDGTHDSIQEGIASYITEIATLHNPSLLAITPVVATTTQAGQGMTQ